MPINQNQSLYSLLGTTYGGDGRTSFALPDLRSRTPVHPASGHSTGSIGQKGGTETVTLTTAEMGAHSHTAKASSADADNNSPKGDILAAAANAYRDPGSMTALRSGTVPNVGGGAAHDNMQPYLAINFCIALKGLFPSRN